MDHPSGSHIEHDIPTGDRRMIHTIPDDVLEIVDTPEDLRSAVFTVIGAASVCWDGDHFLSTRAMELGLALLARIDRERPTSV